MKRRKQFVTPKVIQVAEVCLEKDLLGTSLEDKNGISSMGQPLNEMNFADGNPDGYEVDWNE